MVSSASRRPFEFVANHIVLDFINTVNARPVFTRDDLTSADDVVEWAQASGVLHQHVGPSGMLASQFEAIVDLRERLYRVFGPISQGREPPTAAVGAVVRKAADAMRSADWNRRPAGFEPDWGEASIASICDRLADEAMQLLRSPAVHRIGSCDGCGWLFLDVSRAHARRWCSMNVCGVRSKMRRYHQRQTIAMDAT
jgi:predicted RNA-binding Zn ribbon-like protein